MQVVEAEQRGPLTFARDWFQGFANAARRIAVRCTFSHRMDKDCGNSLSYTVSCLDCSPLFDFAKNHQQHWFVDLGNRQLTKPRKNFVLETLNDIP